MAIETTTDTGIQFLTVVMPSISTNETVSHFLTVVIPPISTVVVAIVTSLLTYYMHKSSKEKEIQIASMNNKAKSDSERATRLATLIESITNTLTELENAMGKFSGVFRSFPQDIDQHLTEKLKAELGTAFDDIAKPIANCIGAKAKVNLLGDRQALAFYKLFLESLFRLQRDFNPRVCTDRHKLSEEVNRLNEQRERMMDRLSSIYLGTHQ